MKIHISSQANKDEAIKAMFDLPINGAYEVCIKKLPKTRTSQQNKALHLFCKLVSDQLSEKYTVQQVLAQSIEREWTPENVKNLLWRPLQIAITGKESTAEAITKEYPKIHKYLEYFLGDKFGVYVPWPIEKKGDK
jgi:hypothetical protein